ncbi:MAG: phosphotransferase [Actinomycetota bacterium]|nr:phosphotransferase [Actinomycetota bacterium]
MAAGRPDVAAWPGVEVTGVLTGGARAEVFAARRGEQRLVVKVSSRSAASLAWELDLLEALAQAGVHVPAVIPTGGGDRSHEGVVVQSFLPGQPPSTADDWQRVAAAISTVHEVTRRWPQRPGSASATQLVQASRGADVDLTAMPPDAVSLVRACWQALLAQTAAAVSPELQCVVHGDFGPGNVLIDDDGVGIIDWDEARVDVPAFDLAALPDDALADPSISGDPQLLRTAALAWEVATCWTIEPDYARRCLRQLQHP